MKVWVLTDIPSAKGIIPAGEIIDIPPEVMGRLRGKVEPVTDGKELATYCPDYQGGAWCSCRIGLRQCQGCGKREEQHEAQ